MGGTEPVGVTGGSDGITAHCLAMQGVARRFGDVATDLLGLAWTAHGYLAGPELLASAALDPAGFATFEATLAAALDGPSGVSCGAARCGQLGVELQAAAQAYAAADRAVGRVHDATLGLLTVPAALAAGVTASLQGRGVGPALQHALTTDPQVADAVVAGLALPPKIATAARALPDGHGVVRDLGVDRAPVARLAPRRLSDVLRDLDRRNTDEHHGAIDVRLLTLPDGSRRAIVDITGTKSWTPLPTGDVTSLTTDGRGLVGRSGAYEHGVLAAMRRAGVRPDDDVMMVGHSEGGLVAVTAARDAVRSGRFRVTHVVTAGSPIGRTVGELPPSVQVLALENSRDVVPHADGIANPDLPNVTTVRGAHGNGLVKDDHSLGDAYVPLARDAEASGAGSVRSFLAGADGFMRAKEVRTHCFQVTRGF